ncbi:CDP-diglyceride synthetase [Candidatus Pantoea edessiphila]|uniref:Phosphatidate cytidylyltransferase n=1 Tax=Candidatus Pantoea edessiphila TaxID=2044610 RepID=A0A2P5T275_9GAMM|nr:phosphatidate cytidylyltransferase [Candidatus Pantoea edessiphila]PPI88678.1 CDP-diglyceride synthetase [Candidatus Pantoea edessiphila]
MLKNRFFTALILTFFVIISLFLLSPLNFALVNTLICMLAAWEWSKLSGITLCYQRLLVAVFFGLILIFLFKINRYDIHSFIVIFLLSISGIWWLIALLLVLTYPVSSFIWKNSYLIRISFGMSTLIPFFYFLTTFRYLYYDTDRFAGSWLILFIIFLVSCVDASAYFFGKVFGKYKLAPIISPNKTWEGFLGSLFFLFMIIFLFSNLNLINFSRKFLIFFSFIITFASLLGDLTESMLKREIGIKDSSNIIPGHGGILDRIDSLTIVVPMFGVMVVVNSI